MNSGRLSFVALTYASPFSGLKSQGVLFSRQFFEIHQGLCDILEVNKPPFTLPRLLLFCDFIDT